MRQQPLKSFRLACLRHRRRWLSGLAFVAVLLLLVMPTTGRLLGKLAIDAHGMGHAMVMADGTPMAVPDQPQAPGHAGNAGHTGHPVAPDGNPLHLDHGNCPYCLLLGSIAPLSPGVLALAARPVHHVAPTARRLAYVSVPHHGLGARGPPPLL